MATVKGVCASSQCALPQGGVEAEKPQNSAGHQKGHPPALRCSCWHCLNNFVQSLAKGIERGSKEAIQCSGIVEMLLQILSQNRSWEARDLLGKSMETCVAAGWSFPPLPHPPRADWPRGRKCGAHTHHIVLQSIPNLQLRQPNGFCSRCRVLGGDWLAAMLSASHRTLAMI